jgi:hypothetical protein
MRDNYEGQLYPKRQRQGAAGPPAGVESPCVPEGPSAEGIAIG